MIFEAIITVLLSAAIITIFCAWRKGKNLSLFMFRFLFIALMFAPMVGAVDNSTILPPPIDMPTPIPDGIPAPIGIPENPIDPFKPFVNIAANLEDMNAWYTGALDFLSNNTTNNLTNADLVKA